MMHGYDSVQKGGGCFMGTIQLVYSGYTHLQIGAIMSEHTLRPQ